MTKPVTLSEIVIALNAECRKPGGQKALARKCGVISAYVNMVVNGARDPTGSILRELGFKKIVSVSYERV